MEMKRPTFALFALTLAFASCQTAHRAAVGTFRVIDAPHQYIRRALSVDDNDDRQTTTTVTERPSCRLGPSRRSLSSNSSSRCRLRRR